MRLIILLLLVSPVYAGGENYTIPDKQIECEALIPVDLEARTGWKVVRAEDRLTISEKVYKRKAEMQRRQTLLCRDVSGGKVNNEFVVYQWWYKERK